MPGTRPRVTHPGLTRDVIVAQALAYAERGDLGTLSLRRLADELDVTPMALYRHVRDKDEILAAVADHLLAAAGVPVMHRSWKRFMERIASSLRGVLTAHPAINELITRQPLTTPTARARLEAATDALRRSGFDTQHAVSAYAAVHTYTIGFCALEAGRHAGARSARRTTTEERDPVAVTIEVFVSELQFYIGLRALLDGMPGQP